MRRVGGAFVARGSIRAVTLARTTMKIGLANLAINYVNYVLRLLSDSQPPLRMAKTTERRRLEKCSIAGCEGDIDMTIGQGDGLRTRRLRFEGDRPTAAT